MGVSHIQITAYESNTSYDHTPIAVSDTLIDKLQTNPDIRHFQEFITKPGIIKTDNDFMGVILKGVSDRYDWDFFRANLLEGSIIQPNDTVTTNPAILSKEVADKLHLKVGDRFTCYFIQDPVRARRFDIIGIYQTNFEDYDKLFVVTEKRSWPP